MPTTLGVEGVFDSSASYQKGFLATKHITLGTPLKCIYIEHVRRGFHLSMYTAILLDNDALGWIKGVILFLLPATSYPFRNHHHNFQILPTQPTTTQWTPQGMNILSLYRTMQKIS